MNYPALVSDRLPVLDGWRAVSLLCVLAAHLLPIGPKWLQGNATLGVAGMACFFVLSGFLITRTLLVRPSAPEFLIRRVSRIVPLAWLAITIAFPWFSATREQYVANVLFVANLWPATLPGPGGHLWSVCVEFQFYVGIAAFVAIGGRASLRLLPALCVSVTLARIVTGTTVSIATPLRVDEILAGATLALIDAGTFGPRVRTSFASSANYAALPLLLASAHPSGEWLAYLRPYLAALLLGATLTRPVVRVDALLRHRSLAYVAEISYAVYVIHFFLTYTWLGGGDTLVRYLKRPLLLGITFALAHLSTFYFERYWIDAGKRLANRMPNATDQPADTNGLGQD